MMTSSISNAVPSNLAVYNVLAEREVAGEPIRVGMIGAGATGRAIALQLGTPVRGMRLAGISNRTPSHAERAYREAGFVEWKSAETAADAAASIRRGVPIAAEDPEVLLECDEIDIIVEVTGTVDFAAGVALRAFEQRKPVILVNAELDSLLGPLLSVKAKEAGVVLTHTDGDEPGVAMTLFRYLESVGLRPVAAGNIKGMVDHYRTPETQREFAARYDQDVKKVTSFADATKLSMETTVLANATGFGVAQRGMCGPACDYVRDLSGLLPADAMLSGGIVDYSVGAAPHTGAWVIVHEDNPLKQAQLAYYKLGDGPFYVFYTPFHLPHIQIPSTIGRAVIHNDPTVAPLGRPSCEVVTIAKRDLRAGESLDGVGGFCSYGLIENREVARAKNLLPLALSEDCTLVRDVPKGEVVGFDDVKLPAMRLSDQLWQEQCRLWPVEPERGARAVS